MAQNGLAWSLVILIQAMRGKQVAVLRQAAKDGALNLVESLCYSTAINDRLLDLQWLRQQSLDVPWIADRIRRWAAWGGAIAVLAWLQDIGVALDASTCADAALEGRINVIEWARARGLPWDERACSAAAAKNRLAALQWLRARGCPWDASTCAAAAKGGHLEALQWARQEGCPWDAETMYAAVEGNHQDVLCWALEHSCPFV